MIRSRRTKPRPGRLQGEDLEALRVDCWLRDEGKCQECGKPTNMMLDQYWPDSFHMAHIRGKRMWGDSLENVRTLCGDCHRREHNPKACPPKQTAAPDRPGWAERMDA